MIKKNKLDSLTIFGYSIAFFLVLYSIKFLTFLVTPKFYNVLLFISNNKHIDEDLQKQIILDFPVIMYQLIIIGFIAFGVLLLISLFFFKKAKRNIYEILLLVVIVSPIWYFGVAKFMKLNFYDVVSRSVFSNLKIYLCINAMIYILVAFLILFFVKKRWWPRHG